MGIPVFRDFQGAVGTVENRCLVFRGFHGPGFSTALGLGLGLDRLTLGGVAADDVRAEADGYGLIQVLVDGHGAAGQGASKAALLQLPVAIADRYGVVLVHHSLGL